MQRMLADLNLTPLGRGSSATSTPKIIDRRMSPQKLFFWIELPMWLEVDKLKGFAASWRMSHEVSEAVRSVPVSREEYITHLNDILRLKAILVNEQTIREPMTPTKLVGFTLWPSSFVSEQSTG